MRFQNPLKDIYKVYVLKIISPAKDHVLQTLAIISITVNQRQAPLDQLSLEMTHRRIDSK